MPDFANTIVALERSGKLLGSVVGGVLRLVSAHSNPELLEIDKEMSLRQARHWNPIMMNAVLFGRVALLHGNRATLDLTAERCACWSAPIRASTAPAPVSTRSPRRGMAEINERLAHLATAFSHHLLGDEQDWTMELAGDDFAGLPEASSPRRARRPATERGMDGKAVMTLSRSFVEPFLKSADRRDLREKVFKAFTARGDNGNANDNNAAIVRNPGAARGDRTDPRLSDLRRLQAGRLDGEDAGGGARPAGAGLEAGARARDGGPRRAAGADRGGGRQFRARAWDWRYYAEKLRQRRANFDEAAIKPYLALDDMIEAAFYTAHQLFGLTFAERNDVPVWHPDVRVWEVKDAAGKHKALFYGDYFARPPSAPARG